MQADPPPALLRPEIAEHGITDASDHDGCHHRNEEQPVGTEGHQIVWPQRHPRIVERGDGHKGGVAQRIIDGKAVPDNEPEQQPDGKRGFDRHGKADDEAQQRADIAGVMPLFSAASPRRMPKPMVRLNIATISTDADMMPSPPI